MQNQLNVRVPYLNGRVARFILLSITAAITAFSSFYGAAQNNAKTPVAQYWMDVATFNMMGMDEMPELPPGMPGMFGSMMGATSAIGRDGRHAKGVGNFGQTKHASGHWCRAATTHHTAARESARRK
jgi:hypothetical protein